MTSNVITGQLARELMELVTDYNSWRDLLDNHPEYIQVKIACDAAKEYLIPYHGCYVQTAQGVGLIKTADDSGHWHE